MAAGDRISGKDLYATFGAVVISGDFTSVSVSQEGELVDVTAGAETFHYFLSLARTNGSMDIESFYDGGTETVWDAVVPNAAGTLIVAPKGTAAGSPKWTVNRALVQTRNVALPFDGATTYTATFQFSAAVTESTW